jgi:hypothetical protein
MFFSKSAAGESKALTHFDLTPLWVGFDLNADATNSPSDFGRTIARFMPSQMNRQRSL